MAAVSVTTLTIKPDRMEDYLENARKWKALHEKHGAKNVRLLAAVVAGEATGSLAFIAEADDFAAWGALIGKLSADPEAAITLNTSGSAVASYQGSIWADIPL